MTAPPTLVGHLLFGSLLDMQRDRLDLFMRAGRVADVTHLHFPMQEGALISHPELAKRVLVDDQKSFGKQTSGYDALRIALGQGLVTSEGAFWRRQRRIAQPAFHRRKIAGFAESMAGATEDMLAGWELQGKEPLDIADEMMALTLRIVGECLCSTDLTDSTNEVGSAVHTLLLHVVDRITQPVLIPLGLPTPKNRRLRRALVTLDRLVFQVIEARRQNPGEHEDLLEMFMSAVDEETGEIMSDQHLRDELITIILAGHETTANALSWTFLLLSRFPAVAERLREELTLLEGRAPTADDLARLPYTKAVIEESMRLYPPVWLVARSVREDVEIGGYTIPKDWLAFVSPYVLHRDPRFWENPEGFEPERFLEPRSKSIARGSYLPFITGPRQCIGAGFAIMEAQIILAMTMQRFELDLVPGHPVRLHPTITLRPEHGIAMHLRRAPATSQPLTNEPGAQRRSA